MSIGYYIFSSTLVVLCFAKFLFYFQEIKSIVDTGVNCIVSGGKVGEMALHFCNKYNILVVRLV